MHIHILGICGTFMGGIALLARARSCTVSGSDANAYPPMSDQLEEQGITLYPGYDPAHLRPRPDLVLIGNALSRGNPAVEYVLNEGLPYQSGPEWLARHILPGRWVMAAAGTHGKTTTSYILAWLLQRAGLAPGHAIGGVSGSFPVSAALGDGEFFVVEGDEYDSAFFDKRSKFIHYAPRTLILNNLEYDHADIFADLAAIQRQFHQLLRTVPGQGLILLPRDDGPLQAVLAMGCWTPCQRFGLNTPAAECRRHAQADGRYWNAVPANPSGSEFVIERHDAAPGGTATCREEARWDLIGEHNVKNGLAAVAAAQHAGVGLAAAVAALASFQGVRRRLELRGSARGVAVYDDFAHHPTAIAASLNAMAGSGGGRLIAVIDPRSNTMRSAVHQNRLATATAAADWVVWHRPPGLDLDVDGLARGAEGRVKVFATVADIVAFLTGHCQDGDRVVVMSNGGFGDIHRRLLDALAAP